MSYDLFLRSDSRHSAGLDHSEVSRVVAQIAWIEDIHGTGRQFEYMDAMRGDRFLVTLDCCDEEGNSLERPTGWVNRIHMSLSGTLLTTFDLFMNTALVLSVRLGWCVHDPMGGEDIHPEQSRRILAEKGRVP